jgi:hypothetical protein
MLLLWKDGLIGDGREYHQSEQWLLILLLNYVRFLVGFVLLNLVFCVVFCRSLSVHCPFSFGHCFSDLRIMIIHFVSSNSSIKHWNSLDFQIVEIDSNDTNVVPNHSKSDFFFAFSAYRQRKMVLTSRFWFKVEYCFTIVFYENVDIKFSAHDVFLE